VKRLVVLACVVTAASCGAGTPSAPSGGSDATTITITSAGASPVTLTVSTGTRVRFVNNDGRAHNMTSDPHPEHGDCPELNSVGLLQPGQSRESGNLNVIRTCGFHDHDDPPPAGSRWSGRITIR
jgi:plastocyanin